MSDSQSMTPDAVVAPPAGAEQAAQSDPVRRLAAQLAEAARTVDRLRGDPTRADKKRQRGDLARLRRLHPGTIRIPPEVFWRVLPSNVPRSEEGFWHGVLPLMAKHPHQRGQRVGRVLRDVWGLDDHGRVRGGPRLERWLRFSKDRALIEADRLLQRLDESQPFDWIGFGLLLFRWDDPDDGERRRRDLARDFFRGRPPSASLQPTERGNE